MLPQMLWTASCERNAEYFNAAFAEYSGLSAEQLTGRGWFEAIHPEDRSSLDECWRHASEACEPFRCELRLRRTDGAYLWHVAQAAPIRGENTVKGWFGSLTDIHQYKTREPECTSMEPFRSADAPIAIHLRDVTVEKRKSGEEQLHASALLDALFDNAPVGLGFWDKDLRYVRLNEALARINGLPVEAHLGRSLREVLPDLPVEAEENRRRVIETGLPITNVLVNGKTLAQPDIEREWMSSYYPVRLGNEIVGVGGVVVEVTEIRRAQEALLDTERQFRVLADSIPALCWMANADGHIFWYNQRWYEHTGTTPEEMEGWGWQKVHDPAILPAVMERWKESLANGTPFEMTFPLRGADGSYRQFLTRISPVRNSSGEVVRWFGANTDVTAARQTEQALRASELRLRRILDSGVVGILYWTLDGRIVDSNDKFLEMVGYNRDDVRQGRLSWIDMTPGECRPLDQKAIHELTQFGVSNLFEKEFFRKDGTRVPVILGAAMLDDAGGVSYLVDVTPLKQAQEELHRSNEDLRQFAWAASHDLQEPLRMVTAYTQMLNRSYGSMLGSDAAVWMTYIVEGAKRIELLLRDLREYWQVSDRVTDAPVRVDTTAMVSEAISFLEPVRQECGGTVKYEQLPEVLCQETPVLLLFQNLISNALKYREPGRPPVVRIAAHRGDTFHEFSVSDNGIGIAPEHQAQIFGIFKRLHRHEEIPGTGMGLALCKRVVERYGGTIRVESIPGRGSTFRFTLPAAHCDL